MKKQIIWGILIATPLSASLANEWHYSHAIDAAQRDDWKEAQQRMSALVVDDPDNASLLYDNGVAAYRMKEYGKAAAYFEQASQQKNASLGLQEQAVFNLGNAQVALNRFENAIHSYEEVLKINPNNEPAQHNLQKVREYLAQQKQQQQQNDKQKNGQDKKESPDQRDTQKNENNKSEDEQKQENGQHNAKQSSQNQQGESDQNNKQDEQSDNQQGRKDGQEEENEGKQDESAREEQKKQGANNKEGDSKDHANNQSQCDRSSQQQEQNGNTHNSSPQQQRMSKESLKKDDSDDHHTQEGGKSQEMQAGEIDEQMKMVAHHQDVEDMLDPKDQWMAQVLRQREHEDEQENKRIVKAMINRELAGKNGQNCW